MLFAKKLEEPKSIGSWTRIGSRYEKPNNEINSGRYWKYVLVSILPTTHRSLAVLTMIGDIPMNVQIVDVEQQRNTAITEYTGGVKLFSKVIEDCMKFKAEESIIHD